MVCQGKKGQTLLKFEGYVKKSLLFFTFDPRQQNKTSVIVCNPTKPPLMIEDGVKIFNQVHATDCNHLTQRGYFARKTFWGILTFESSKSDANGKQFALSINFKSAVLR